MRVDIDTPELPDGSVINGTILITSYFDGDGEMKYAITTSGSINLAQALGLIELAKITVYESYMSTVDEQEDDDDDDEQEEYDE